MHVSQLTSSQKQELRQELFYPDDGKEVPEEESWKYIDDVPDSVLEREFGLCDFVEEDFSSSCNGQCDTIEYKINQVIDLDEQIWKSLILNEDNTDLDNGLFHQFYEHSSMSGKDLLRFYLNDADKETFEIMFEMLFNITLEEFLDKQIEIEQEELYRQYCERR